MPLQLQNGRAEAGPDCTLSEGHWPDRMAVQSVLPAGSYSLHDRGQFWRGPLTKGSTSGIATRESGDPDQRNSNRSPEDSKYRRQDHARRSQCILLTDTSKTDCLQEQHGLE